MLASYLIGERVAMRAVEINDKDDAAAWFEGAFPISPERAEAFLREELDDLSNRKLLMVIVRMPDEEIVGGVRLRLQPRYSDVFMSMAPALEDADELCGEALKLLVPWLRDEGEHITVTVDIAADQLLTVAAAESAGMEQTARIREWYFKNGQRVDRLIYQAINPHWQTGEGTDA